MPHSPAMPARAHLRVSADRITMRGIWGQRLEASARQWSVKIDEDVLLDGFRQKPGFQFWIGEHLGKFSLGALPQSLLLKDQPIAAELRAKIDRLIRGLIDAQESDGYLGTYARGERWFGDNAMNPKPGQCWDLWVHKYGILALLAYYDETGLEAALRTACRAADVVLANIGTGERDIGDTDVQHGLASGSILEAIMRLYQVTGEERYLQFAHYIVKQWDVAKEPRIMRVLREGGDICSIGRGKAYEMMSCFVGLLEYAMTTGRSELVQWLLSARDRIADMMRYPTGGSSVSEYFKLPGRFPEHADIETCVTFTWIQFNLRLFEYTGDARALDLVEEAMWNQLVPALSPDGTTWTYHLPITGPKKFLRKGLQCAPGKDVVAITCCHTNGQRGLSLVPQFICTTTAEKQIAINFYVDSETRIDLSAGSVRVGQQISGHDLQQVLLTITPEVAGEQQVLLRCPAWSPSVTINGKRCVPVDGRVTWKVSGPTTLRLQFETAPRVLFCGGEARGKCAVACGPLVLALDQDASGAAAQALLDRVVLVLGQGDPTTHLSVTREDGWPIVNVPAALLPAECVSADPRQIEQTQDVRLIPVMLAGIKHNPMLTQAYSQDAINYHNIDVERQIAPEYRVTLPYFWLPKSE